MTVSDQSIPVGITRKVVPSYKNPSKKEKWPLYDCPVGGEGNIIYDQYGFAKYGETGNDDEDNWMETFWAPGGADHFTLEGDKLTANSEGGPDDYAFELRVTKGTFGYFKDDDSQSYKSVQKSFGASGVAWYVSPSSVETPNNKSFTVTIKNDAAIPADYEQCSLFNLFCEGSTLSYTKKIGASGVVLTVTPNPEWPDGFNHPVSLDFSVGDQTITESFDIKITAASGGGGGGSGSSGWHFDNTIAGCTYGASADAAYQLASSGTCTFFLKHDGYDTTSYETVANTISGYLANSDLYPIQIIKVTFNNYADVTVNQLTVSPENDAIRIDIISWGNGSVPQDKVTTTPQEFTIKIVLNTSDVEETVEQSVYFVKP